MTQPETRGPLPARSRVSPLIEYSPDGSLYPYWDFKTGLNPYINMFLRAIANYNPLSFQQIPTSERMGLGIRNGRFFYRQLHYPNQQFLKNGAFSAHYHPMKELKQKQSFSMTRLTKTLSLQYKPAVSRFCARQIQKYKSCSMANGNNQSVCKQLQDNVISICPQWSLHNLRQKKLAILKDEAMSNKKYRQVMQVPEYNKGRTVADVPHKTWEDGTRENVRPGTLWADDRYVDVTIEQIKAAKERVKKRRQANPLPPEKRAVVLPYDRAYQAPPKQETLITP